MFGELSKEIMQLTNTGLKIHFDFNAKEFVFTYYKFEQTGVKYNRKSRGVVVKSEIIDMTNNVLPFMKEDMIHLYDKGAKPEDYTIGAHDESSPADRYGNNVRFHSYHRTD